MKRNYSLNQLSIYIEFYSRIVDLNRFFFGSMKFQEADDSQKCHFRFFLVQIKVNVEVKIFIIIVLNYWKLKPHNIFTDSRTILINPYLPLHFSLSTYVIFFWEFWGFYFLFILNLPIRWTPDCLKAFLGRNFQYKNLSFYSVSVEKKLCIITGTIQTNKCHYCCNFVYYYI